MKAMTTSAVGRCLADAMGVDLPVHFKDTVEDARAILEGCRHGAVQCELVAALPVHYMNYEAARVIMDVCLRMAQQVLGRWRGEEVL